jgi:two-component sensor histidine kinase
MPYSDGRLSPTGLPETPPDPPADPADAARAERASLAAILLLVAGALVIYPRAAQPGPHIPGLTAFFAGILVMGHGCVAWLATGFARSNGNRAVLVLAMGYLASALLAAPYMAVFPGALVPDTPFVGTDTSAAWLFTGLNLATAIPSLLAALMALRGTPAIRSRARFDRLVTVAIAATVLLAIGITAAAIRSTVWLPKLVNGNSFTPFYAALNLGILSLHATAAAAMLALRGRLPVFAWAAVAHVAAALAHVVAGAGGTRFSLGWTYGRISYTFAALVVLIYFLQLFTRQQKALATANDRLETRVLERTTELATMVNQRDTLLREVYHRVRNNLAIIDGLTHFQLRAVSSPDGRAALLNMRGRVKALAVLHDQLVVPIGSGSPSAIDLSCFLEALCGSIAASSGAEERGIEIRAEIAPRSISAEVAAPLGMIVSELVTNAVRHAFPEGGGLIRVRAPEGRPLRLAVEDSGTTGGGPRLLQSPGMGGQIVKALARQLGATLEWLPADGVESRVQLSFP